MTAPAKLYKIGSAQDFGEYRDILESAIMENLSLFRPNFVQSWYAEEIGADEDPNHIIYYLSEVAFNERPHNVDEIVQIFNKNN